MNELQEKQKEVEQQLQMAEDDVTQVNDLLSMLQDSKEVDARDHACRIKADTHGPHRVYRA